MNRSNGYEQYKALYRAEVNSLRAQGVEIPKSLQRPLSEIEYRFRVAAEGEQLFGEENMPLARRIVDQQLYERSSLQAKKVVEAAERANKMFGTNFSFSEEETRMSGFNQGKGAEFWDLVKNNYHEYAAEHGAIAAKAYIGKIFFGSD